MKLKLLGKMLLYTLLPVVIGLSALALIVTQLSSDSLNEMADRQLMQLVKKQAHEIDVIIQYTQAISDAIADGSQVRSIATLVTKNHLGPKGEGEDGVYQAEVEYLQNAVNASFKKNISIYPNVNSVLMTDLNGICIGGSNPQVIGKTYGNYKSIAAALKGDPPVLENRQSQSTGLFVITLSSPVYSNDGERTIVGSILVTINLEQLSKATIADIKLLPSTNIIALDTDSTVLMTLKTPELTAKKVGDIPYIKKILSTKNGIYRYVVEDIDMRTHFAELPYSKYIIAIETHEDEFLVASKTISIDIIILSLIVLILVAFIVTIIIRKIAKAMRTSVDIANEIASGNLHLKKEQEEESEKFTKRGDEISELILSLKKMLGNLIKMREDAEKQNNEIQIVAEKATQASEAAEQAAQRADQERQQILDAVEQLEHIVNAVALASEKLTSQIELSTNGANEQAQRVAEAATAMEEMNCTVLEVARNTSSSAEITENTRQQALNGAEITQKCKTAINTVREESIRLRTNMSALAEHAQSINTVMGVITDIADQTNLLALNAAIEAARAGDAGRGFAVVADEVRKLAEKTITSTTDVSNAILAIQQSTETNVKQVDVAVQGIEVATELANQSGEALEGILEMAVMSADGVRVIATASEEQSSTSEAIANSISVVNTIASETSASMREASQAVVDLAEQSQHLASLIENLKEQ